MRRGAVRLRRCLWQETAIRSMWKFMRQRCFESGGGLVHSRAFVRDVTERRLLEQQIQQYTTQLEQAVNERTQQLVASQARYKALFDFVADSVFMVGEDGLIVAVNKREEQALGYSEQQVVGSSILNVIAAGPPRRHG